MNIKVFAFILTVMLLLFGVYFVVQNYETCYTCNTSLTSRTFPEVHNKTDIYFAVLNFVVAMISVYLITIKKFNISAIVSGVVAGLQVVAIGTVLFLTA